MTVQLEQIQVTYVFTLGMAPLGINLVVTSTENMDSIFRAILWH